MKALETFKGILSKADNWLVKGIEFKDKANDLLNQNKELPTIPIKKNTKSVEEDITIQHDINTTKETNTMIYIVVAIVAIMIIFKGKLK